MKSFLFFIKLFSIFLLFSFIGISPASSAKESVFPEPYECYRPYEAVTTRMEELTAQYPDLARLQTIGQSFEGRPIQVLQLGRQAGTDTKPRLVLVSGLQANALASVELNLRFAESLLDSYGEDANVNWLLDQVEIHLIMVANPDGRLFAEMQTLNGDIPTWTKNKNSYECANDSGGVALGNNFSYAWASASTNACVPVFSGPSAASEPETQAIQTYLELTLSQNPERSLVIDLQSNYDQLLTPFLYSKAVDNPLEDELYLLANKLTYGNHAIPVRGNSPTFLVITGNLTDYAFGQLHAPALRFNLGPNLAGGDTTQCWYFNDYLSPEGIVSLTRAAYLAADPLSQAQGPEIVFAENEQDDYSVRISGQADDMFFYKKWPDQNDYSAIHHVSFSLDTLPWQSDTGFTEVDWSQPLPDAPYMMNFDHTFQLMELSPGKHTVYFQAWDTNASGEAGHSGMINAIELNVPYFTFIPILFH